MSGSGGIVSAANCPHEPGDSQYGQNEKTNGNQPHEKHADPTEGTKTPSAHHTRTHHAPAAVSRSAIAPAAQQACRRLYNQQRDNGDNHNRSPINLFHFSFLQFFDTSGRYRFPIRRAFVARPFARADVRNTRTRSNSDQPFVRRRNTLPF